MDIVNKVNESNLNSLLGKNKLLEMSYSFIVKYLLRDRPMQVKIFQYQKFKQGWGRKLFQTSI